MSSYKFREDVIKQAAKKGSQLHLPRQALQKNFRENGVAQAGIMAAKHHKATLQKDPQTREKEALYRAFLKGLD